MRKLISTLAVLALSIVAVAPASAARPGYAEQNGYGQSTSHTACADHGAFAYFNGDNNLGNSRFPDPGADGQATGENNSQLCGNPHND